jgi:hypothetical protein
LQVLLPPGVTGAADAGSAARIRGRLKGAWLHSFRVRHSTARWCGEPASGGDRYVCAPKKGVFTMRMGISLGGILLIILILWLLFGRG